MATRKSAASGEKNDLTGSVRVDAHKVGTLLQDTMVELIDLQLRGKQAHWNLAGPHFRPLHLQLDEMVKGVRKAVDSVAERAVAIGYAVDGRPATVAKSSPLPEFPAGQLRDSEVVELITSSLEQTCGHLRQRVYDLGEPDLVSQDLLIGVLAKLEEHHWMFAVQH